MATIVQELVEKFSYCVLYIYLVFTPFFLFEYSFYQPESKSRVTDSEMIMKANDDRLFFKIDYFFC